MRMAIGGSSSILSISAGGVAYVGVFGRSDLYYQVSRAELHRPAELHTGVSLCNALLPLCASADWVGCCAVLCLLLQPAFVFPAQLGSGYAKYVCECHGCCSTPLVTVACSSRTSAASQNRMSGR